MFRSFTLANLSLTLSLIMWSEHVGVVPVKLLPTLEMLCGAIDLAIEESNALVENGAPLDTVVADLFKTIDHELRFTFSSIEAFSNPSIRDQASVVSSVMLKHAEKIAKDIGHFPLLKANAVVAQEDEAYCVQMAQLFGERLRREVEKLVSDVQEDEEVEEEEYDDVSVYDSNSEFDESDWETEDEQYVFLQLHQMEQDEEDEDEMDEGEEPADSFFSTNEPYVATYAPLDVPMDIADLDDDVEMHLSDLDDDEAYQYEEDEDEQTDVSNSWYDAPSFAADGFAADGRQVVDRNVEVARKMRAQLRSQRIHKVFETLSTAAKTAFFFIGQQSGVDLKRLSKMEVDYEAFLIQYMDKVLACVDEEEWTTLVKSVENFCESALCQIFNESSIWIQMGASSHTCAYLEHLTAYFTPVVVRMLHQD